MITPAFRSRTVAVSAAIFLLSAGAACADDIKVMTSGAFTAAYLKLAPQFERATGHHLVTEATSMGTGAASIEARLAAGEAIDVVIVADAALEQLIKDHRIVPGTRVDLARSAIGMAVRKGAPKPDISSVDALRRALLGAKSIAYSASVSGSYLSTELFQRLGVADQVLPKSRRIENERVGAVVARGDAEIGFQQISELLPEPGIDFVGPLPADVQRVTVFSAGIGAAGRHPDAAKSLITFLASPTAIPEIRKTALEPAASSPPAAFNVVEATIDDVRLALASKQVTCRTLVEQYIRRIEAYDKSGPALNAVQTINRRALEYADRLDAVFAASGPVGPLHCVPMLMKDQVETIDMPTSYGSVLYKDFIPKRDATVVSRLKTAGAVIVAKTTMGEFASGYLGSAFGIVHNAYDPARIASGSSGGTGAGIAANFATAGIGEDTGGSVRGPAAVNNLVGLRPTTPLVSRFGMLPARPSTDTLGPITRSVRDAAIVLDVIAGYDADDPVTADAVGRMPASYTQSLTTDGLKGVRIGVIREPLDPKADPKSADYKQVRAVIDGALTDLTRLGAVVVDSVAIPDLAGRSSRMYDTNVYETEAATNKYFAQHPNAPVKTLSDILLSGKVVPSRARVLMNSIGHSTDERGYLQLLLAREELRQAVLVGMADQRLDALVYATFDHPPLRIPSEALTQIALDSTGPGNNRRLSPVIGFPAMTVPAGFTADGLPVGLEFMGRPFAEPTLFRLAYAYEQGTHHRKAPASMPALSRQASAP
jgi:Asp-tRNA(Asn)/Glu-tRNA(Gln) amidotransferase A subunit family amidase/ABC-type molybdate transport system substrate-binding protein